MLINDRPQRFSLFLDPSPCTPEDTALVFRGDSVVLRAENAASRLPNWGELAAALPETKPFHLFTQDERRVFLAEIPADAEAMLPDGLSFEQARVFRLMQPREDAFLLNAANHLNTWYRTHRFCGACGTRVEPAASERALLCPACGLIQYPTIAPAIIVAITDGAEILLARNAHGVFKHYSLIAGYVEVGETLEQAVRREIMEEVGLRVRDIHYLGSQPWGLSQSMMIGFHATLDGPRDVVLQESELADARWFTADRLPEHASPVSIAYSIIERFREGDLDTPLES